MSHEGIFGIRPTGAIGIGREKMHAYVRRQHLVLRPHVQMLESAATKEECCFGAVVLRGALGLCAKGFRVSEVSVWEV